MVNVGDTAPDFTLPGIRQGARRDYTLSEFRGQRVVLAFYPGDDTAG
jgi:peroxiredoxin